MNDSSCGVLNLKNDTILPFEYEAIEEAHGNYIVMKDGKYGLVSKQNKLLIPIRFKKIYVQSNGYGVVRPVGRGAIRMYYGFDYKCKTNCK